MAKWSDTIPLDNTRFDLNGPLTGARNKTMLQVLGNPRGRYSSECQPPENRLIKSLILIKNVGPFRVQGLRPAVETLETILADIAAAEPDIHSRLGHVGMLCCRFVRGSTTAISNHSWGTAIDLTIDGILDQRGNTRAQRGLMQIHPHFNRHGFFWGAAFPTEDAMHFEASDELIRRWHADGKLGDAPAPQAKDDVLDLGDRGVEVAALQRLLSKALDLDLGQDGIFGSQTRAAVIAFQSRRSLRPDGAAGSDTMTALKAAAA